MTSNKKMSQFDATQTQKFEHDENLKAKRVISVSSVISTQWSRVTVDTDSDVREATFFFDQYNEHNRVTVNNTNLQSKYFLLDDALNAHNYYVWFNIDSGGTDPALVGRTGLEVPLTASYGVNTIAQAIQIVLNISAPNYFEVSVHDNVLEIINAEVGQSDGARDGNTGFDFTNVVEGVTTQVDTIILSPPTDYIYLYNEFEKEFVLTQNVVDKIDTQFNPVIDTNNQTPTTGVVLPAYLGTPYEDSLATNSPLPVAPADMYLGDWTEVTKYAQISAEESATNVGKAFAFYSIDGGNTLYRYTSALVSDTKGFATFPKGATHYCIGYQNRSASTNTYTLHTVLSYVQQGDLKFPASTPIDDDFMVSLNKTISVGKDPNLVYKDSRQGGYVDAFTSFDVLGSGEVFDSGTIDCAEYTQISTELRSDQEGTLSGVWYQDEAGTIPLRSFSVPYTPIDDIEYFSSAVFSQYLKLTFTNGATPQGFFHLRSRLDTTAKHGQMLGLESFIPPNSLINVNRTVGVGKDPNGIYQNTRVQGTHSGNSTTIPLNANETYRGEWFKWQPDYTGVVSTSASDVAGTLYLDITDIENPTDGVDDDVTSSLTIPFDPTITPIVRRKTVMQSKWVRHRYVNGVAAQTTFNLEATFLRDDIGLISIPARISINDSDMVGITKSILSIPKHDDDGFRDLPVDSETGDPTNVVSKIRDDILIRPLNSAQMNQIVVGNTATRLDPIQLSNRREITISNDGNSDASVGISDTITFNSNSFILKAGAEKKLPYSSDIELWGIAKDVGGVETIYNRSGTTASGTVTNPSNALTSDDSRANLSANAQFLDIDGFTAGTTNDLISVRIGLEARKQSGQFETTVVEEIASGETEGAGTVSTTSMSGGTGQLYVVYVTRNSSTNNITQVLADGVFLTPLITNLTSGNRRMDVWYGYGDFASGVVTASMSTSTNAHIVAYRISGADPVSPIQDSGTSSGTGTVVVGPTLNKTAKGYSLFGVSHLEAGVSTATDGYTKDVELSNKTGSNRDSIVTIKKALVTTGTESGSLTLQNSTSWAGVGVTIKPNISDSPIVDLTYEIPSTPSVTITPITIDSITDTTYYSDVTGDRSWVYTDIPNVTAKVIGNDISASSVEIDHLFIEVTDTTGATTRISVIQSGRDNT